MPLLAEAWRRHAPTSFPLRATRCGVVKKYPYMLGITNFSFLVRANHEDRRELIYYILQEKGINSFCSSFSHIDTYHIFLQARQITISSHQVMKVKAAYMRGLASLPSWSADSDSVMATLVLQTDNSRPPPLELYNK